MKKILILLLIVPFFFACKDDASSSSEPETKPVVQVKRDFGESCTSDDQCNTGLACSGGGNGQCLRAVGSPCTSDGECASGSCEISEGSTGMCSSN